MIPRATYRLQFHKDFTFHEAAELAPYLRDLGISHVYASPILAARAGSEHGYDVTDHAHINPDLGGEEEFRALANAMRSAGIGIILDIVPNHMAVGGADNPCWLDLLEKGRDSVFADLFDIDWEPAQANLRGKVLVPFLELSLRETLERAEIQLVWDENLGKLAFAYYEHRFPLRREDYAEVGAGENPAAATLDAYNTPAALQTLLAEQNFRLAEWRIAAERINWRRFFDITGLAALRIEDNGVFELVHATVFRLFSDGLIDGVRVDHIDGLADPRAYCRRLRSRLEALLTQRQSKEAPYLVVEKILARGERLPQDWGVDGTTGYDFMEDVSALQHCETNAERFGRLWARISGRSADFETEERSARRDILVQGFANALRSTAASFQRVAAEQHASALGGALSLLLEDFRAYRTYAMGDSAEPAPGEIFDAALRNAKKSAGAEMQGALAAIEAIMRGAHASDAEFAHDAVRRFNQLAAPLAAKAVEDTAFYRYGRLLSRNDVGSAPDRFGISTGAFLQSVAQRRADFPRALLATATHDHKRGEDTRARLAVLSEIPGMWESEIERWRELNAPLRPAAIEPGDEYQLYQTLFAAWSPGLQPQDRRPLADFTNRIQTWRQKSLREAKLKTSWTQPDEAFEQVNADFVAAILDPDRSPTFLGRLAAFVQTVAPAGICNSLAQCVLRNLSPGIPDLFQGTELWDFSLVDPDNRRAVNFALRRNLNRDVAPASLLADWHSGQVKLALIRRLLGLRSSHRELFTGGDFGPVGLSGRRQENVLAFLRAASGVSLLVAVPRLCAESCIKRSAPLPFASYWEGTQILLPPELAQRQWRNVLDPNTAPSIISDCSAMFAKFPAAVLMSDSKT
jgi:(1->4)-alpha-D-glucan 1-alpha-D-glucosylmutase